MAKKKYKYVIKAMFRSERFHEGGLFKEEILATTVVYGNDLEKLQSLLENKSRDSHFVCGSIFNL